MLRHPKKRQQSILIIHRCHRMFVIRGKLRRIHYSTTHSIEALPTSLMNCVSFLLQTWHISIEGHCWKIEAAIVDWHNRSMGFSSRLGLCYPAESKEEQSSKTDLSMWQNFLKILEDLPRAKEKDMKVEKSPKCLWMFCPDKAPWFNSEHLRARRVCAKLASVKMPWLKITKAQVAMETWEGCLTKKVKICKFLWTICCKMKPAEVASGVSATQMTILAPQRCHAMTSHAGKTQRCEKCEKTLKQTTRLSLKHTRTSWSCWTDRTDR